MCMLQNDCVASSDSHCYLCVCTCVHVCVCGGGFNNSELSTYTVP